MQNNNIKINTDFTKYIELFKEENSKINLVSRSQTEFLYEKHIYDSLSIKLFFEKYNVKSGTLLDIGTGGGFPSFPIAIEYPDFQVFALDSIKKKTVALQNIKNALNLANLTVINARAEDLKNQKFDIVTARAVSDLKTVFLYSFPLAKNYMVFYKSKKVYDEIKEAENTIKKHNCKIIDIMNYKLPTEEDIERNLVIVSKSKN
ncbi:16S rRNA (guanine(527)-N(7))-methyltransferase RsmG [bacterium]|nr:16S rRNA (guanine(527)-N(7))-methyltransferase RsmG [bacterium]